MMRHGECRTVRREQAIAHLALESVRSAFEMTGSHNLEHAEREHLVHHASKPLFAADEEVDVGVVHEIGARSESLSLLSGGVFRFLTDNVVGRMTLKES